MSTGPTNPSDVKMLPSTGTAVVAGAPVAGTASRQLIDLPLDELQNLAEEFGLDATKFRTRQHLVAAVHDRRQMIASLDRDAMLDVIRWGRRPVTTSASKEQLAQEIARISTMRFAGLSHRGLYVLAKMRGCDVLPADAVPLLIQRLRKKEGFFQKISRKRRAMMGSVISKMIGGDATEQYRHLPPGAGAADPTVKPTAASLKREIEDQGIFGGITNRLKKTADSYVNQKLDEIEARIDRKLDEIDRKLGEWRDKEVANRIRILKITLWASVIVAGVALIYSYIKLYVVG